MIGRGPQPRVEACSHRPCSRSAARCGSPLVRPRCSAMIPVGRRHDGQAPAMRNCARSTRDHQARFPAVLRIGGSRNAEVEGCRSPGGASSGVPAVPGWRFVRQRKLLRAVDQARAVRPGMRGFGWRVPPRRPRTSRSAAFPHGVGRTGPSPKCMSRGPGIHAWQVDSRGKPLNRRAGREDGYSTAGEAAPVRTRSASPAGWR